MRDVRPLFLLASPLLCFGLVVVTGLSIDLAGKPVAPGDEPGFIIAMAAVMLIGLPAAGTIFAFVTAGSRISDCLGRKAQHDEVLRALWKGRF